MSFLSHTALSFYSWSHAFISYSFILFMSVLTNKHNTSIMFVFVFILGALINHF